MPKVNKSILNAARELGTSVLERHKFVSNFELFGNTSKHMVFKATSQLGRPLCLKINLVSIRADLEGLKKSPDRTELEAFEIIGDEVAWAPRTIDSCEDATWLLREWVGDNTSNRIDKSDWTRGRLDNFWKLFSDAFNVFHDRNEPYLLRDLKPTNVSYDEQRFYMFDFNTAKRLAQIKKSNISSRLGNNSNRYAPPELLRGDFADVTLNADYFGFATIFHRYATGLSESVWSNSKGDDSEATEVYKKEYEALKVPTEEALANLGYSKNEIEFLIACLNPSSDQRPETFLGPR